MNSRVSQTGREKGYEELRARYPQRRLLARSCPGDRPGTKDVAYLPNILGCGQVGEDRMLVKKTLAGFRVSPECLCGSHRWTWM